MSKSLLIFISAEVLKQPLKTAVSVQLTDFEKFNAQEKMHLIISVKDFKSIITHADTLKASVSALYSTPGRPLQFNYALEGLQCQFTLMTAGDCHSTPASSTTNKSSSTESFRPKPSADNDGSLNVKSAPTEMPPPTITKARKLAGKLGQNESATGSMISSRSDRDSESLFVQQEEEDRQWDPAEYDNEEESLGWNATIDNVSDDLCI
jgi:cell cycle checkpoint control protein RAD9A